MALDHIVWDASEAEGRAWPRRRIGSDGNIDMTPMIDVTFLLLIFFMFTRGMTTREITELPQAVHGSSVDPEQTTTITLLPGRDDGPARVLLGDDEVTEDDEDAIRRWVSRGVSEGRSTVLVNAAGNATSGQVWRLLREVSAVEGATLRIGTREKH